jgi:hypothetical protein
MTSHAQAEVSRPRRRSADAILAWLERDGILVVLVASFAMVLLARIRGTLVSDGWTALVAGRYVVQHGLPSHDTLVVWSHGREWVDQQWLAQIALYGLDRIGGLALVLLAHVTLAVAGFGAALALARHRGASARSATWVGLLALIAYFPGASVMRPQSFAYVLFVALLWILCVDARRPSRRVYLVLPIIALWANLHGSVVLPAALVSLYGLILGVERAIRRSAAQPASWRRVALLTLLPWLCMLASPYGPHLVGYYHHILLGSGFSGLVTEWAPTTLTLVTAPFYVLALGGIWLIGRVGDRFVAFEKVAFALVTILGLTAVRNLVWFALVAVALLPVAVDALRKPAGPDPARLNRMLGIAGIAAVVVTAVVIAGRSQAWYLRDYPSPAANAVAAAAGGDGRVFSNELFSDWLIWSHPELAGRVAFDTRFELMTKSQIESVARFRSVAGDWHATIRGYRVLVLDPTDEKDIRKAILAEHRAKVVYQDMHASVLAVRTPSG